MQSPLPYLCHRDLFTSKEAAYFMQAFLDANSLPIGGYWLLPLYTMYLSTIFFQPSEFSGNPTYVISLNPRISITENPSSSAHTPLHEGFPATPLPVISSFL
jgi:hypothetical protein